MAGGPPGLGVDVSLPHCASKTDRADGSLCLKKDADRADWIYVPNDPVPSSKNSNTGSFSVHANLLFAKGSVLQTWPSAFMRKPCCCKS